MAVRTWWRAAAALGMLTLVTTASRGAEAAAFKEWTGFETGDLLWSSAVNWSDGVPPADGDYLTFGEGSLGGRLKNDLPTLALARIEFEGTRNYILEGNGVFLDELTAKQNAGTHTVEFNIAGDTRVLVAAGAELVLSGANSFTGDIDVFGELDARTNNALGTAAGNTDIAPGGSLRLSGRDFGQEQIRVAGEAQLASCAITNEGGDSVLRNIEVSETTCFQNFGGTLNFPNGIKEYFAPFDLLLLGGNHTVGGATAATGAVRVTSATNLTWNSSAQVQIVFEDIGNEVATGDLRGSGTAAALVFIGGTFAPGTPNASGRFTLTGALAIQDASFSVLMNSAAVATGYAQATAGTVAIGPNTNLVLVQNFDPSIGQQFRIIDNTGGLAVTGTFNGLPEGAKFIRNGRTYTITYKGGSGNDVVITRVEDEPGDPYPFKRTLPMLARS